MSKLGVQSQNTSALSYICQAGFPIWKIIILPGSAGSWLGPLQQYKQEVGGLVIARVYQDPGAETRQSGHDWAMWLNAQLWQLHSLIDYVELTNEPGTDEASLRLLNSFTIDAVSCLHQLGYKVIGLNFGVGNPAYDLWPIVLPACNVIDLLGLHQYDWPTFDNDSADLIYRHEKVHAILEAAGVHKDIFLGEVGIDGGVIGLTGHGWRSSGLDGAGYRDQLLTLSNRIDAQPYVAGAAIYGCGMNADWYSFDTAGVPELTIFGGHDNMAVNQPTLEQRVAALEQRMDTKDQQYTIVTNALMAACQGVWTGAGSVAGWVTALRGGISLPFTPKGPTYPNP